jgi:hypothetical protein
MAVQDPTARADFLIEETSIASRGPTVSWGAILAGAFAAAALSFILLSIGTAFGLSVASPWDINGREAAEAAATAGIGAAVFLIVIHAISSGLGGYLAGRLRTKATGIRGDETYFRDTAHGLVVWAVSAVATVLMLACLALAAARGGVAVSTAALNAAGEAASGAAAVASSTGSPTSMDQMTGGRNGYFIDALFRPAGMTGASGQAPAATGQATDSQAATTAPAPSQTAPTMALAPQGGSEANRRSQRDEIGRIFGSALDGDVSAEDKRYIVQLVSQETRMTQPEAEQRVNQVLERAKAAKAEVEQKAKEAADAARKAAMYTALWGAVAMLAGAFSASLAAAWGGRARDLY